MSPTFRSFVSRNYRFFFVGALVNNVGTWMGRTAQSWLVLTELTDHDAAALGIVTALQFLPMVLLAPFAGLAADRFAKRRVLTLTQGSLALVQLVTAALVLSGTATLASIYVLTFLYGAAAAVDAPTRQAFVSEVVGPDLLSNAVGLNSANFNTARLIGPALAGLLIALVGTGWVFVIDAVSVAAIIVCLWLMDPRALQPAPRAASKGGIRAGIAYVVHRPDILLVLAVVFVHGTFGMNFQMTIALMATTVYGKGPGEFGLLGSIMAIGSLAAALLAARRPQPRLAVVLGGVGTFAVANTVAALAPTYWTFAILLVLVGLTAMTILPTANSLVQLAVEPQMRGRVMALYMAIFMGGTPLGAPVVGWIGAMWGARWTMLVGSIADVLVLLGALAYLSRGRGHLLMRPAHLLRRRPRVVRYGAQTRSRADREVTQDEPTHPTRRRPRRTGGDVAGRGRRADVLIGAGPVPGAPAVAGAAECRADGRVGADYRTSTEPSASTASMQAVNARTSSGSTAGNTPTRN